MQSAILRASVLHLFNSGREVVVIQSFLIGHLLHPLSGLPPIWAASFVIELFPFHETPPASGTSHLLYHVYNRC